MPNIPHGPARASQWLGLTPPPSAPEVETADLPQAVQRCLQAGDARSALAFWRSKRWTSDDRERVLRLLRAATDMGAELLTPTPTPDDLAMQWDGSRYGTTKEDA